MEQRSCFHCSQAVETEGYTTVDNRRLCAACFQQARQGDGEGPAPLFRCSVCGHATRADELEDLLGRAACPRCIHPATHDTRDPAAIDSRQVAAPAARPRNEEWPRQLLRSVTCPHCWNAFSPGQILWVSQHTDLLGDPIAGPDQQLRFRPTRFTARGEALDLRDMPCLQLACPRCHLVVPRVLLEAEPLILSIIGAPASGKSHFVAALTWELRRVLADHFDIAFNDAEPDFNRVLNEYEETLFLQEDVDRLVALRKTELHGELYDQINLGEQVVAFPRPFLFTMRFSASAGPLANRVRVLCMYDNAGEHFQPGMDSASTPGTQHLTKSRLLMFLFDPTQHPRLREQCRVVSNDPQVHGTIVTTQRQETVLLETASRIRRHAGISVTDKYDRPLLVLVSKADIWGPLAGLDLSAEPLVRVRAQSGSESGSAQRRVAVDLERVEAVSRAVREFLARHAPNVITAAEDSFSHVTYLPVSSLGSGPSLDAESGMLGVRSRDVKPRWVTVPLLYALAMARNTGIAGAHAAVRPPGQSATRGVDAKGAAGSCPGTGE